MADQSTADMLKAIENAYGIVTLRLSEDEWSQKQGARFLPDISTYELLGMLGTTALKLAVRVKETE